jgi:hypothetical protein
MPTGAYASSSYGCMEMHPPAAVVLMLAALFMGLIRPAQLLVALVLAAPSMGLKGQRRE